MLYSSIENKANLDSDMSARAFSMDDAIRTERKGLRKMKSLGFVREELNEMLVALVSCFGMTKKQEKAIPYFEITNQPDNRKTARAILFYGRHTVTFCVFSF